MSTVLQIVLETQPLDRIEAELAVAGLFVGDRPLRGGAARADWRLCGRLSELVESNRLTGARGDVVLMPSAGRLRCPRALFVGLGDRAKFRMAAAQDATQLAISRALAMGMTRVALAPLGVSSDDLPRHAQALLGGAWEAVRAAERPLRLFVSVSNAEHARARASLQAAIQAADIAQITLLSGDGVPSTSRPRGRSADPAGPSSQSGPARYT